ncbi:MAG: AI-2E family transporter [Chloroflexota bacterium]
MAEAAHPIEDQREPLIPRVRVTQSERNRLILVGIAAFVLIWLLVNSWGALGPFIIALVLAYLMLPLVDRIARVLPRVIAILLVYAAFIILVTAFFIWLIPATSNQLHELANAIPGYQSQVQNITNDLTSWYQSLPISQDVRQSIENAVRNSLGSIGAAIQQGLLGTIRFVSTAMGFIIGLLIIPFWLFYVLKDKDRGIVALNNMMPKSWRNDIWRIFRIINGILSSYIRGQLILALAVGIAVTIGMIIVGAPYAILLGLISGLTEIVPIIGPVLGAIPGLALAAFHPDGWIMVLKVLIVYVVVQQLENNLLVPKIQGDSVKLHPSIIMVSIVVGSEVAGLVGLIIAVPVAAMLRDIYLYLYRRFTENYTPRQAEASVPSREDEESSGGKGRLEQELEYEQRMPGVQSTDELLNTMDAGPPKGQVAADPEKVKQ